MTKKTTTADEYKQRQIWLISNNQVTAKDDLDDYPEKWARYLEE